MIYITRRETFNAAHKLYHEGWSKDKNAEVFGKCANPNWHGHNYILFITVKGEIDPETGYVIDLKKLSDIAREKVVDKLDHKNINLDVDFMHDKMASTEILAISIWEQLQDSINSPNCKLHCIKLHETENNYVEYYGPESK
jgi:6-pyruvoyltetrahydropterin/6-carboxytetrahydropterin synthase